MNVIGVNISVTVQLIYVHVHKVHVDSIYNISGSIDITSLQHIVYVNAYIQLRVKE